MAKTPHSRSGPRSRSAKPRYDLDLVRQAASPHWVAIIQSVGGVARELLDGQHHPCPKCGGNDRFRFFADQTGGAICNQCFNEKNGDGFSVLQWLTGGDFLEVVAQVAGYLNISPLEESGGGKRGSREYADPAEHLNFLPWSELSAAYWCLRKPPITPAAIQACGGHLALYRDQYKVVAIPVYGEKLLDDKPVGWCLYNITGGPLPKWSKNHATGESTTEWVKVKLTHGSQPGVMGTIDRLASPECTTAWKLEGPSDVLALVSLADLPANVAVLTNANGAKERPATWMLELFRGRRAWVCHDADKPGQDGAIGWTDDRGEQRPGWATAIATTAADCRNVLLPYAIDDENNRDLRDFLNGVVA